MEPILLDLPDSIETARLLLRSPRAGDGPQMLDAITEALPELRRFLASLPWVALEQTLQSAETFCRTAQSNFLARKDLPFVMFDRRTQRLLGTVGLHRTVWQTPKTEVGYWIRTSSAGQGYVSEAVRAMLELAFGTLQMARVELITDEDNAASRRVAERCGFVLEGTLHNERRAPDGSLRHTCVYARLPPLPA